MNAFRRFKKFGVLCLLMAFLGSLGGHWLILQSYAWGRMAISYSKKETVPQAIQKTFDGKHPCKLCHRIQKKASEETKKPSFPPVKDPEPLHISEQTVWIGYSPLLIEKLSTLNSPVRIRAYAPPTPPPRA